MPEPGVALVVPRASWHEPVYVRHADGATSPHLADLALDPRPPIDRVRLAARVVSVTPRALVTRTAYEGISRVRPASVHGEADMSPLTMAGEALASALREALRGSVARAMAGATRVAVMVGGGVDSSVLTALACAEAERRGDVTVVPIAMDYAADGDDRPHLRALAEHVGMTPVRVRPADAAPFVRSGMIADAAPMTWPSVPLELAMAAAARREGAELVLTGAGGDDLFDGSPYVFADLARTRPLRAVRAATTLVLPWRVSKARRVADFVVRPWISPHVPEGVRFRHRRRRLARSMPWAGPTAAAVLEAIAAEHVPGGTTPSERYDRFATSPHLVEVATLRAQFAVATGLRRVDPFLDDALARFTCRIDPPALLTGNRLRGLFREAARGLVPDSVRLRGDKAAFEPAQVAMVEAAGGFGALESLARGGRAAALGLIEPAAFRDEWAAFVRDPVDHDWLAVWPVLAVEAFLQANAA